MKSLQIYINEYIIKNKLDKPIDSGDNYNYFPNSKDELIDNLNELVENNIYDFNCIDTSAITNMFHLFNMLNKHVKNNLKYTPFDVSKWNVSNVTNMSYMFFGCKNFNCDLSSWDVSKVKDMSGMFSWCVKFNCDLSNWDVSNANNMDFMFYSCENFNCDLSKWNVSNVKNMICMFKFCKNFTGEGLENWNISKVNTSKVNTMSMLDGCKSIIKKPTWYKFKIK